MITETTRALLENYTDASPGVRANLVRLLEHGALGGSGRLVILPIDQGFEHGPTRSFSANTQAFDPLYHFSLAYTQGLSALAAPLGFLECGAHDYAGALPLILKVNSATILAEDKTQAITATISDALRLGCVGIGITYYPGSTHTYAMIEDIQRLCAEAKAHGLVVVVWSYPRSEAWPKEAETALDIVSYGAHMAALLGAHIIKVKLPSSHVHDKESVSHLGAYSTLEERVDYIMQCAFAKKRLVVFSGGALSSNVLEDVSAIHKAGGSGSIVGRNIFQRPYDEACALLSDIISIYTKDLT